MREAAGDRFNDLELSVMIFRVAVTDQRERAVQQIAPRFGVTPEQALSSVQLLLGTTEQIAETLWTRRERFGISYIVINEEQMDIFAPVVAYLSGK